MSEKNLGSDRYEQINTLIDKIESEMKRIGYWNDEPLPDGAYQFQRAFGMDTMTFPQWLQFVLIPRVHEVMKKKSGFPERSMVGVQAIREFDGNERASKLVGLLNEFDRIFDDV